MTTSKLKMPKRLWIVAAGLILVALMGLSAIIVLLLNPGAIPELEISIFRALISSIPPVLLLTAAILLLMRRPKSNQYVMISGLLYFGLLIGQNAYFLLAGFVPAEQMSKPAGAIVRGSLWIMVLAVTMYSDKLRTYLDEVNVARSIGNGT